MTSANVDIPLTITIYHQCYYVGVTAPTIASLTVMIGDPTQTVFVPSFDPSSLCVVDYTLTYSNANPIQVGNPLFSYSQAPLSFSVLQQTDYTKTGTYNLLLTGQMRYGLYSASASIVVKVICMTKSLAPNSIDCTSTACV